jgi:hypothetical protein
MDDRLQGPQDPTTIRDEQVARALDRLDERGDLTAEKRAVVERLGHRLTAKMLWLLNGEEPS